MVSSLSLLQPADASLKTLPSLVQSRKFDLNRPWGAMSEDLTLPLRSLPLVCLPRWWQRATFSQGNCRLTQRRAQIANICWARRARSQPYIMASAELDGCVRSLVLLALACSVNWTATRCREEVFATFKAAVVQF